VTEPDRAGAASFTIREVRPDEYEALGELTVRAYADHIAPRDAAYVDELLDVGSRAAAVPVLVAVDPEGRVLGGVAYVPGPGTPLSEGAGEGEASFRMLAVDPSVAGHGIGRALAMACLARARAAGRTTMALYTLPSMTVAHRLYESLGFRRDPARDWEYLPGESLWSYVVRFEDPT
jgi:ribosomal protein S18 acetylase RimI-like enzyme